MWRKIVEIFAVIVALALIVAYAIYASRLAEEHRAQQRVESVIITLSDSKGEGNFATSEQVYQKLEQGGYKIHGELIDSVDAVSISQYLSRDGYVSDVTAYVTYSGKMHINIEHHHPILRLMSGGMNAYITESGEVFCQPIESAYYASVITGNYMPHFAIGYEGNAKEYFNTLVEQESEKLRELGNELASVRVRRRANDDPDKFADFDSMELQLKRRQQVCENFRKKIEKKSVDFANLINFVSKVNRDSFWSAEIVQFVADTTYMGEVSLRLIPRSGNFEIEFGTLNKSDEKLAKLRKFYANGLPYVGWERYKVVDVRYDKQIICRE